MVNVVATGSGSGNTLSTKFLLRVHAQSEEIIRARLYRSGKFGDLAGSAIKPGAVQEEMPR